MTSDFDRDNQVDRLLKGARRDAPIPEAGPACLDAETLAAWADGGLDADRVQLVQAHVADCARCQSMAAVFFSAGETVGAASAGAASTATGANVVPFRRNKLIYWIPIAAGTIAATLVIWLGVPGGQEPVGELAMNVTAPAPAPAAPSIRQEPAMPAEQLAAANRQAQDTSLQRRDAETRPQGAAKATKPEPAAGAVRPSAAPIATVTAAPLPVGNAGGVAASPRMTAPPPPAMVTVPPIAAPPPTVVTTQSSTLSRSASEAVAFRSAVDVRIVAEFSTLDPRASTTLPDMAIANRALGTGRGGGGGGRGGAARVANDAAPAVDTYWRIMSTGTVERSADRVTWDGVPIDPPVSGLTAGSAPATNVSWIVGKSGLVLLSTDGRTFTRVTAPTSADLRSITATNARQASVLSTDGRTYVTADGGKTWTARD